MCAADVTAAMVAAAYTGLAGRRNPEPTAPRSGHPYRVRRPRGRAPDDRGRLGVRGGSGVFYTIVFAGLAVLLVIAVMVQKSRKK
jgi:hypothetical protein